MHDLCMSPGWNLSVRHWYRDDIRITFKFRSPLYIQSTSYSTHGGSVWPCPPIRRSDIVLIYSIQYGIGGHQIYSGPLAHPGSASASASDRLRDHPIQPRRVGCYKIHASSRRPRHRHRRRSSRCRRAREIPVG